MKTDENILELRKDIILAKEVHTVIKLLKNKGCENGVIPDYKEFGLTCASPLSYLLEVYYQYRLKEESFV